MGCRFISSGDAFPINGIFLDVKYRKQMSSNRFLFLTKGYSTNLSFTLSNPLKAVPSFTGIASTSGTSTVTTDPDSTGSVDGAFKDSVRSAIAPKPRFPIASALFTLIVDCSAVWRSEEHTSELQS